MSKKRNRRGSKRQQNQWMIWTIGVVAVLALGLWGLSGKAGQLPEEGKRIANFVKTDVNGNRFELSQAYKEGEVILVFYRGLF